MNKNIIEQYNNITWILLNAQGCEWEHLVALYNFLYNLEHNIMYVVLQKIKNQIE